MLTPLVGPTSQERSTSDCFSMLFRVLVVRSRFGCGTVTFPFLLGCLKCLWLPVCPTSYQPSFASNLMTSRLDLAMRPPGRFLHIISTLLAPATMAPDRGGLTCLKHQRCRG